MPGRRLYSISELMPTFSQLRQINWGSIHMWGVKIEDSGNGFVPEKPFNDWFPATNLTVKEQGIELFQSDVYGKSYYFPQNTETKTLSIGVVDDDENTLYLWWKNWQDQIAGKNTGGRFLPLSKSHIRVSYYGLNSRNGKWEKTRVQGSYLVIPESGITWTRSSETSSDVHSFDFKIVGD